MKNLTIVLSVVAVAILCGCGDSDNRTPTKEEGAAADATRQSYIDSLNIPEDQKARMKAQMGGPAVPNPADQAKDATRRR